MTDQTEDDPSSEPVILDNPLAPDVFADEAVGFFARNGVVSITFTSARVNHAMSPSPVTRVVTGRVVMPISAAQGLAEGLFDFLIQQGLTPRATPEIVN